MQTLRLTVWLTITQFATSRQHAHWKRETKKTPLFKLILEFFDRKNCVSEANQPPAGGLTSSLTWGRQRADDLLSAEKFQLWVLVCTLAGRLGHPPYNRVSSRDFYHLGVACYFFLKVKEGDRGEKFFLDFGTQLFYKNSFSVLDSSTTDRTSLGQ